MVVIDANVAIEVARKTNRGVQFEDIVLDCDTIIAPSLFVSEAASAAWKHALFGAMDESCWKDLFKVALSEVDEFVPDEELFSEALHEAVSLRHSVYDMLYYVLARRTASPLLTCDQKLAKLCTENGVECITLAEL